MNNKEAIIHSALVIVFALGTIMAINNASAASTPSFQALGRSLGIAKAHKMIAKLQPALGLREQLL